MAPPAGAGSCRTGRRPRSGACPSTVGDAAQVPGAPRDAHGSAPCAFGETGPMAVGSRAMDRMNRVHPPTCPYGPWTVARWTGTPSSGPVHGPGVVRVAVPAWAFAWTTYLIGPPNGPWSVRVVRDAGPHMGFRVGRMIGPACGPLVHSHDVDRKRAGHADGPHASTWPIRPPGPRSRTPPMAHTAGPDRGPGRLGWPMVLVDAVFRVRSARPADGGYATTTPRPFYSSCRAPVNSMSQTIIRTPGHSRHRRACIPCRTRRPCRVLSRRPFSSVPRLRGTGRSPLRPR